MFRCRDLIFICVMLEFNFLIMCGFVANVLEPGFPAWKAEMLTNYTVHRMLLQIVCDQHGPPGKTHALSPLPHPPKYLELTIIFSCNIFFLSWFLLEKSISSSATTGMIGVENLLAYSSFGLFEVCGLYLSKPL